MRATDQMLARVASEVEERQKFVDGVVEAAEKDGRDLTSQEMELVTRAQTRMGELGAQMEPLKEASRIALESRSRIAEIGKLFEAPSDGPRVVEYRTAGAYILDYWKAALGADEPRERLELFQRAAAHQTTADNPGLIPESIVGPVINLIDATRPLVSALGPRQLPSNNFSRPRVTQNTQVAAQSAEKSELVSRKMLIGKTAVVPKTYGGYVNVSRQDIDWTQPAIMDIVLGDLAAQYAIETENATVDDFTAAATVGPTLPTGAPTAAQVASALWAAAGAVFTAMKGQGRVIAVTGADMLGILGPLFPPVNPQNAQSAGFAAGDFSTGLVGSIAGIPIYISSGMAANTILVLSTAAGEVYEDRIGALQVVEPSVLGVQVAYAGYFADVALVPTGMQKIVKTP